MTGYASAISGGSCVVAANSTVERRMDKAPMLTVAAMKRIQSGAKPRSKK
jgi:hypothetical protein